MRWQKVIVRPTATVVVLLEVAGIAAVAVLIVLWFLGLSYLQPW